MEEKDHVNSGYYLINSFRNQGPQDLAKLDLLWDYFGLVIHDYDV